MRDTEKQIPFSFFVGYVWFARLRYIPVRIFPFSSAAIVASQSHDKGQRSIRSWGVARGVDCCDYVGTHCFLLAIAAPSTGEWLVRVYM